MKKIKLYPGEVGYRKPLIHKASRRSKLQPDFQFSCWDSIYRIKRPALAQGWKDVTCPKCLTRR